jgi:hypothetical protein
MLCRGTLIHAVLCCAQVLEALLGDGFAGVSWGLKQSHLPLKAEAAWARPSDSSSFWHRMVQVRPPPRFALQSL